VRSRTPVGIDDNLATGQPAIALRPADHEAPGRVHQIIDLALDQFLGQHGLDDLFYRRFADLFQRHFWRVLGGQHHGVDSVRLAIHIFDGDLRLRIGAQPGQSAIVAQLRLAFDHAVRQIDRERHQGRCFIAGVAKHQSLIARALIQKIIRCSIHTLCDIRALLVVSDQHRATSVVDAVVGVVVADTLDGIARHLDVIHIRGRGDLTR